jgi:hypothetical protein
VADDDNDDDDDNAVVVVIKVGIQLEIVRDETLHTTVH